MRSPRRNLAGRSFVSSGFRPGRPGRRIRSSRAVGGSFKSANEYGTSPTSQARPRTMRGSRGNRPLRPLESSAETKGSRRIGEPFKHAAGRSSSLVDAAACRSRRWFQCKAAVRTAFVWATGSTPSRQQTSPLRFHSRTRPPHALNSLPGADSTGRTVRLLTSSDPAQKTVVEIRSAANRLEAPRADALVCLEREPVKLEDSEKRPHCQRSVAGTSTAGPDRSIS